MDAPTTHQFLAYLHRNRNVKDVTIEYEGNGQAESGVPTVLGTDPLELVLRRHSTSGDFEVDLHRVSFASVKLDTGETARFGPASPCPTRP